MTSPHSPLDAHTTAFRTALDAAATRRAARSRRTRRGIAVALPLAGAATIAVAAWPGEQGTVLERAAAALTPETGVIHFRITSEPVGMKTPPRCAGRPADAWIQTGPRAPKTPSWRIRTDDGACLTGPSAEALGHMLTGRSERWWDGKNTGTYAPDDGWAEELTDVPARDAAFPDTTGLMQSGGNWWESTDPITGLRRLIRSGKVQPAGTGTVDGRRVQFLKGPWDVGDPEIKVTMRIAVDAQSFAPVEIVRTLGLTPEQRRQIPADAGAGERIRFLAYDTATAKDLKPQIPDGTDTASRDYREFRKAVRAARAYPPEPVSKAEQARAEQAFAERHPGVTPSPRP